MPETITIMPATLAEDVVPSPEFLAGAEAGRRRAGEIAETLRALVREVGTLTDHTADAIAARVQGYEEGYPGIPLLSGPWGEPECAYAAGVALFGPQIAADTFGDAEETGYHLRECFRALQPVARSRNSGAYYLLLLLGLIAHEEGEGGGQVTETGAPVAVPVAEAGQPAEDIEGDKETT